MACDKIFHMLTKIARTVISESAIMIMSATLTLSSKPEMPMPEAAAVPARPMKCPDLVMILMILVILICCDGDDVDYKINHRRPEPGGDHI